MKWNKYPEIKPTKEGIYWVYIAMDEQDCMGFFSKREAMKPEIELGKFIICTGELKQKNVQEIIYSTHCEFIPISDEGLLAYVKMWAEVEKPGFPQ